MPDAPVVGRKSDMSTDGLMVINCWDGVWHDTNVVWWQRTRSSMCMPQLHYISHDLIPPSIQPSKDNTVPSHLVPVHLHQCLLVNLRRAPRQITQTHGYLLSRCSVRDLLPKEPVPLEEANALLHLLGDGGRHLGPFHLALRPVVDGHLRFEMLHEGDVAAVGLVGPTAAQDDVGGTGAEHGAGRFAFHVFVPEVSFVVVDFDKVGWELLLLC
mmetsp:Transcript_24557/g.68450  ORF Transcript_24557/g.68450 Transcript_24557/m.68450 type:complete len:213 (+) Transcript_24557:1089-1727(+)